MQRTTVNPVKIARVDALKQSLSQAKSVAVVDYTGLNVAQATQLRRAIKAGGGEMKVEKNTLFKLALGEKDLHLRGLSAFVFSRADEVGALKVWAEFMTKSGVGKFKAGLLADRVLTAAEVEALAKIPGRETLLAKLSAALNSPLVGLAHALNWNLSQLARVLDAVSKKGVN